MVDVPFSSYPLVPSVTSNAVSSYVFSAHSSVADVVTVEVTVDDTVDE